MVLQSWGITRSFFFSFSFLFLISLLCASVPPLPLVELEESLWCVFRVFTAARVLHVIVSQCRFTAPFHGTVSRSRCTSHCSVSLHHITLTVTTLYHCELITTYGCECHCTVPLHRTAPHRTAPHRTAPHHTAPRAYHCIARRHATPPPHGWRMSRSTSSARQSPAMSSSVRAARGAQTAR